MDMETNQTAKERKKAKRKLKKQQEREKKIKNLCKMKNQENFLYKYTKKMSMNANDAIKELKKYGVEVSSKQKQYEKTKKKEIKEQRRRHREKRKAQEMKENFDFDTYLDDYWCFDYEDVVDYEIGRMILECSEEEKNSDNCDDYIYSDDLPF